MRTRALSRSHCLGLGTALLLFQHIATADPIAYAEQASGQYVRVDFGTRTSDPIGPPLTQYFIVGAFAGDDFSKEYAIEYPSGDLYSIDTTTAETTPIGSTNISDESPTAMQWDPSSGYMLLMTDYAPCDGGNFYALDINTGSATPIGVHDGCLEGLAFDAADNAFSIDVAQDTLVEHFNDTIGPLGFNAALLSALFFDPSSGELYLIAADVDTAFDALFLVDTASGAATLLAPWPTQYSAFALVSPGSDTDSIFANGFDSQVRISR